MIIYLTNGVQYNYWNLDREVMVFLIGGRSKENMTNWYSLIGLRFSCTFKMHEKRCPISVS